MGRFHRHDDGTEHDDHDHRDAEDAAHTHPVTEAGDGDHAAGHNPHGDLSGYQTAPDRIVVLERIFGENDRCAQANRAALDAAGVVAVNMMSSPGAGKTEILRHTLAHLRGSARVGIVEGDIETSIDADRLTGLGAQVTLLNTSNGYGGECHLDAPMVAAGLSRLNLAALDLVFVENVGNLVCPAEFDVGAHHRAMVYAVTEGEEKPLKYPVMFRSADVVLVNKIDLLPHLDFDLALFERNLRATNPRAVVLRLSARTGEGLDAWYGWLSDQALPRGSRERKNLASRL